MKELIIWLSIVIVISVVYFICVWYRKRTLSRLKFKDGEIKSCRNITERFKTHLMSKFVKINDALVIYNNIPYRYPYWSVNFYDPKRLQSYSSVNVSGQNNDGVAFILTSSRRIFTMVRSNFKYRWAKTNCSYELKLYYIPIDPDTQIKVMTRVGMRHIRDEVPQWNWSKYTLTTKENLICDLQPKYECILPPPKCAVPHFSGSFWKIANKYGVPICKYNLLWKKEKYGDGVKFQSKKITIIAGQSIVAIGVNHVKASNLCAYSFLTLVPHPNISSEQRDIITSDHDFRGAANGDRIRVGVLYHSIPGTYYVEEHIYPNDNCTPGVCFVVEDRENLA